MKMVRSSFAKLLAYFPDALRLPLSRLPETDTVRLMELRLRIGRNLHAVRQGLEFAVLRDGTLRREPAEGIRITPQIMDAVFKNLCSHSLHSVQHQIRQGFVTVAGGCRAGLCGTAVMQGGSIETIRGISGINLRIASERTGCALPLIDRIGKRACTGGLLLTGQPASGKTTLLRDLARILGAELRVCILDERSEIAAVQNGIPQFDVGVQTDVFDGYPKADGIAAAVRVMSPQLLICDELGDADEADRLLQTLHAGVQIIASAHASSIAEAMQRPQIARLMAAGIFRTAVLLGSGTECGSICAVQHFQEAAS